MLRVLESLEPGLTTKETVEQSSYFAFSGGKVYTYNDEVLCSHDSPVGGEFEGAAKAKSLLGILRKFGDDELDVLTEDHTLILKGKGGKRATVKTEVVSLPVGSVDEPESWKKLHDDFGEAVGVVAKCAGNREDQFVMTCVHVTPKWVEAVDNFKLCRWRLKTGFTDPVLLRRSGIKHVRTLGMEEFGETASWVHFRNAAGLTMACRKYVEDFPDLTPTIEAGGTKASLPKGLIEAARRAAVFSEENGKDDDYVHVSLKPGKIRVTGVGLTGEYREPKSVVYDGPEMEFLIRPGMLEELVDRHPECEVTANSLKVDGGAWVYVTCLSEPYRKERKDAQGGE